MRCRSSQHSYVNLGGFAIALAVVAISISACQKKPESQSNNPANPNSSAQTSTSANEILPDQQNQSSKNNNLADNKVAVKSLEPITILALGDSLTEGLGVASDANYPAQLQQVLQHQGYPNARVINSGLSGETSTGLVNRLDWVAQTHPDITILTIGANDAIRGIDVATVEANIRTAIQQLQDNGSVVVLGGMQIYDNLGNDYVNAFSEMYPRIVKDTGVTLIPFFLEGVAADSKLNQADAIHPTAEGYSIVVNNNILPVLLPVIESSLQRKQAQKNPPNTQNNNSPNNNAKNNPAKAAL